MALPTRVARGFFEPLQSFNHEVDVLNRLLNQSSERLAGYPVDIREDGDHIIVDAELPGYSKDQVDITLENQVLTITAERQALPADGQSESPGNYLLNERRVRRFRRTFKLPPTVDEKTVQAKLEQGVLTITLSKREESKPRKIIVG